jgi:hypothetical protein
MPLAAIFKLTCQMLLKLSPNRLVSLGGRGTWKPQLVSLPKRPLAKLISEPLWLFSIAFGVLSAQREQSEAEHVWQVLSLYLPDARFRGSTMNRGARG